KQKSDTVTVLEKIGHFLDEENQLRFEALKAEGVDNQSISERIADTLDLVQVLRRASTDFDGGYVMCGMVGHGDAFVMRDPNGIRPAFWYEDDEVVVAASERPVIQTAFNVPAASIQEVAPGSALVIKRDGKAHVEEIRPAGERKACSFERIYFSRGNDGDIYSERKALGKAIVPRVLEAVE
ncbi:MAG: amidophosphoribosyltransferase, partial [Flavobacteriales bacterium]